MKEEPYKVKMYAVDSKGRADYICEATSVEALTGDPPLPDTLTINGVKYRKEE